MEKEELLHEVKRILVRGGFQIGEPVRRTTVFDIISRRDDFILIIKVLLNADSLRPDMARELTVLGHELNAVPIIVCMRSGAGDNVRGVVYSRHSIPVISLDTFWDLIIDETLPMVFVAPGGFYVNINSERLKKVRNKNGISLGELARVAGVSRKAIQLYESGMSSTVDVALQLEEYLHTELIEPIDLFHFSEISNRKAEPTNTIFGDIYQRLVDMGYDVFLMMKCPFEAISRDHEEVMLTGFEKSEKRIKYKTQNMRIFSEILDKKGFVVMSETEYRDYNGVAIIKKREIMRYDKDELKKVVEERSSI